MTIRVRHNRSTSGSSNPDVEVDLAAWEEDHNLTQASERLLGRTSSGDGATEEISVGSHLSLISGELAVSGLPWFTLSEYDSLQAACDAAQAANGGTVWIDTNTNLGSDSIGLDLDGFTKPMRITGQAVPGGSGAWVPYINYTGTGSAVSAIAAVNIEIDHVFFYCTAATGKVINGKDSSFLHVHECVLYTNVSDAGNIGIDLDTAVSPRIRGNAFYILGGTGIRGVAPAGSFSVRVEVAENYFSTDTSTSIAAPGQCWRIIGNTAQNPATCFLDVGPAGTCDTVYLNGNDIDDGTGAKTWVRSNAGCLISVNNRYSNSGTCISQTNSTGAVVSIGDRLEGTVGVAIGTGNYLSIANYDQGHAPTTLYTGTPANTNVVEVIGGAANITGQLTLGLEGATAASLRFKNATSGSVTVAPPAGALGSVSLTLPGTSGTLLNTTNNVTVTLKVFDNTNIYTTRDDRFTLQDSGDTTKQAVFQLSGISTATTRTYTLPDVSDTLVTLAATQELDNKTLDSSVAKGTWTVSGTWTIPAVTLGGAVSGGGNEINNVIIGNSTPLAGTFTAVVGTTVDAPTIRATGTLTNIKGTTGSDTATLVLGGGSGANGGAYLQFAKNTVANITHYFGHESAIFGGGSTSYNVVLYNAGLSGGLAGRVFTASNTDNSVAFASTVDGTSGTAGAINTLGGAGVTKAIWAGQSIKSAGATHGVGYATGAGGTVTQITSKSTAVTLNTVCGQITTHNAALASGAFVRFTVNNSSLAATDLIVLNMKSGNTAEGYNYQIDSKAAGSFVISMRNITGGSLSEAVVFDFGIFKGVSS